EVMTFNSYWNDPRFQRKKPNLRGSKKQAFGDNIYVKNPATGEWHQEDSHHSHADGSVNRANIATDTQADRILVSDDYVYWGGSGPEIPPRFLNYGPNNVSICVVRNHKNNFPPGLVQDLVV